MRNLAGLKRSGNGAAVGITGKLNRAAEVEIRLPRIANRLAAIVALKIEECFRFDASALSGQHRHSASLVRDTGWGNQ